MRGALHLLGLGLVAAVASAVATVQLPSLALLDDERLGQPAPLPSNADPLASITKDEQNAAAVSAAKAAQEVAMQDAAKKEDSQRMLLKPPGCRPTTSQELYNYHALRTKCATAKPAPSAYTTPPTQTPITVTISGVRVISMDDKENQFVMEMTRKFEWTDQAAQKNDPATLWNPRLMFSFPNSVKVEDYTHTEIQSDGAHMTLIEHLRITFLNSWDYTKFPMDDRNLVAQMWSGSGTNVLEPVTVKMDKVELPEDLFGFRPTSDMEATFELVGDSLGPKGTWGKSQMVVLKASAKRVAGSYILKILIPVTLCAMVAYTSFFLKIAQLMPRCALAVLSFLIMSTYTRVISVSIPARGYLVWIEYWLTIQAIILAMACCHHSVCHCLNEKYGETKSMHLDIAMRVLFPVSYSMAFVWTESGVEWGGFGVFFNLATVIVAFLLFIAIFFALEKRTSARYEKSHYPGI